MSLQQVIDELRRYLNCWRAYYGFGELCRTLFRDLESWIRRRLRCFILKHWKRGRTIFANLRKMKLGKDLAAIAANGSKGYWRRSRSKAMSVAFPNSFFDKAGLPRLNPVG